MDEGPTAYLPSPLHTLRKPNVISLNAGEVLHRVHARAFDGNAFDRGKGGRTHFAPIRNPLGVRIPSLNAGRTLVSVVYETIFHDVPLDARRKTVPRHAVEKRRHSTLLVRRVLRLASLRAPDLMKWGVRREQLTGSLPTHYDRTALWAQAIHAQFDDVDGLIWTSNLCDPDAAVLLFGDRVAEGDIQLVAVREGTDESFMRDVRKAGRRGGIRISL